MNDTSIRGTVFTLPTQHHKVHDLTMLYLKNKDLKNINPTELAQMYDATYKVLYETLNQRQSKSE